MKAEEINVKLKEIYDKDTTTQEERNALLEACGCVWASRMNKVVDIASFMYMLDQHMGFDYNVDVKTNEEDTVFSVKTFIKK